MYNGIGGVVVADVDAAFHEESGTIVLVLFGDNVEAFHGTFEILAGIGYFGHFQVCFDVFLVEFQCFLKRGIAIAYVANGKIGVCQGGMILNLFVVKRSGLEEVLDSLFETARLFFLTAKSDKQRATLIVEVGVFAVLLYFLVKNLQGLVAR